MQSNYTSFLTPLLRLAIPNGSLEKGALQLINNVAPEMVQLVRAQPRRLNVEQSIIVNGQRMTIRLTRLRPQEIPRYLDSGGFDLGITGFDCVLERRSSLPWLADLSFSRATAKPVRWVVAVPDNSPVQSLNDLAGKRIASELPEVTRRLFDNLKIPRVFVEPSQGATEAKVPLLADAILEATETGESIRANDLRVVAEVFQSRPGLYASPRLVTQAELLGSARLFVNMLLCRKTDLPELRFARPRRINPILRKLAAPKGREIRQIDCEKYGGIVPAIIQDFDTGQVLMEGWMNRGAIRRTLAGPYVWFWSRSRQKYWMKGESSGDYLRFVDMKIDCDRDALLVRAIPIGAVCHFKTQSCFEGE